MLTEESKQAAQFRSEVQKRMDGSTSQDELCCRFMMTYADLVRIAASDASTVVEVLK